jgi:hypothetical protein
MKPHSFTREAAIRNAPAGVFRSPAEKRHGQTPKKLSEGIRAAHRPGANDEACRDRRREAIRELASDGRTKPGERSMQTAARSWR